MTIHRTTLVEQRVPGRALGRHVAHDDRSRDYPADRATSIVTTIHQLPPKLPLDQGELGSCTGNAMAGLLGCHGTVISEDLAVALYSEATHLDRFRGFYPPTDTGSAGLYVAKAARARGFCTGYKHAFGLRHTLEALVLNPVIIGINWYGSFDRPDGTDHIDLLPDARPRGGHEVLVYGVDAEHEEILICNSWGPEYGDHGRVRMPWTVLERLLRERGDVTTVVF